MRESSHFTAKEVTSVYTRTSVVTELKNVLMVLMRTGVLVVLMTVSVLSDFYVSAFLF